MNNSPADVLFTAGFALVGYALTKLGFETAPLLLGYVLGRLMEENLRRALAHRARAIPRRSSSGRSARRCSPSRSLVLVARRRPRRCAGGATRSSWSESRPEARRRIPMKPKLEFVTLLARGALAARSRRRAAGRLPRPAHHHDRPVRRRRADGRRRPHRRASTCRARSASRSSSRTSPARAARPASPAPSQAPPDGYTIMMGHMGTHGAAPAVYPNLKYDPTKDFAPIGLAAGTPIVDRRAARTSRRRT